MKHLKLFSGFRELNESLSKYFNEGLIAKITCEEFWDIQDTYDKEELSRVEIDYLKLKISHFYTHMSYGLCLATSQLIILPLMTERFLITFSLMIF